MDIQNRYIELLIKSLINEIYIENEIKNFYMVWSLANNKPVSIDLLIDHHKIPEMLANVVRSAKSTGTSINLPGQNRNGAEQPPHRLRNVLEFPHSMIGRQRMDNLRYCIETVLSDGIPGDLIETGVWGGGTTIFMRGMLAAHEICDRRVWVADPFEGLRESMTAQDGGLDLTKETLPVPEVSINRVKELFERYDLLDDQVKFLKGWFKDTLAAAPIEKLAVLRLDGGLYEPTMDALTALYGKVSVGGFVIVDDYHTLPMCRQAVDEFREQSGITCEIVDIDNDGVYWKKD